MTGYDAFAKTYDQLIQRRIGVIELSYRFVLDELGDVAGRRICDLGCGQGELSRRLADRGARVTGIDASEEMLALARERPGPIRWLQDDAQHLTVVPPASFDIVVANLMMMDLPDHRTVFASAWRILVPGGLMVWTVMHPCFQSPCSEPVDDGTGALRHRLVKTYTAQHWRSPRPGTIRATVGAYHRPLSEYLNSFLAAGFELHRLGEPLIDPSVPLEPDQACHYSLPPILGAVGRRSSHG